MKVNLFMASFLPGNRLRHASSPTERGPYRVPYHRSHRPRDQSVVSSLHCMNDPQAEGHMASYIRTTKILSHARRRGGRVVACGGGAAGNEGADHRNPGFGHTYDPGPVVRRLCPAAAELGSRRSKGARRRFMSSSTRSWVPTAFASIPWCWPRGCRRCTPCAKGSKRAV